MYLIRLRPNILNILAIVFVSHAYMTFCCASCTVFRFTAAKGRQKCDDMSVFCLPAIMLHVFKIVIFSPWLSSLLPIKIDSIGRTPQKVIMLKCFYSNQFFPSRVPHNVHARVETVPSRIPSVFATLLLALLNSITTELRDFLWFPSTFNL